MQETNQAFSVRVRNVGGIEEATVELEPGITVLVGENATNRTSFLRSLMAALGSNDVSLRGGTDEGRVELTIDGEAYDRTLRREGDRTVLGGSPYLDDPTAANLFAFLLETNEARRAVVNGSNLRDVLRRPVDTDAIQERVEEKVEHRRQLDQRLQEIERAKQRLTGLEAERQELEDELESLRSRRDDVAAEGEETSADEKRAREEDDELTGRLAELNGLRSEFESVQYELETSKRSRERLEAEFDELPVTGVDENLDQRIATLDERIEEYRREQRRVDRLVTKLGTLVQFNEEMVTGDEELAGILSDDRDGPVTDQLLEPGTGTCWTCGSDVAETEIDRTLDHLRSVTREQSTRRNELTTQIDDLTDERDDLERTQDEKRRRSDRLQQLRRDVATETEAIDRLESRRATLRERIDDAEGDVETLRAQSNDEILDRHAELNELEFEIDQLTSRTETVDDDVARLEATVGEIDRIQNRREALKADVDELRTRIERLERAAVGEFNDRADVLIDLLEYGNVERLWLERSERDVREGRRTVTRTVFDLHVVRTTEDGVTYEDATSHLSESEREVTGLVFALAGYLVHEVYETVPLLLLDSLEAIDSTRIRTVVEYVADVAPNVVVALLPEDARELPEAHARIDDI